MDPHGILGVSVDASDEEIRTAYLGKVKEHPPERSPEEFERIRDAYDILRDPRRRVNERLFGFDPFEPFANVIVVDAAPRRFTGPQPWLEVLKRK